jgi:hypothetical protein
MSPAHPNGQLDDSDSSAQPGADLSPQQWARVLKGRARGATVRFAGPSGKHNSRACTLTVSSAAPRGVVVSDASRKVDDLQLKDWCFAQAGLQPFQPRRRDGRRRTSGGSSAREPAPSRDGRTGEGRSADSSPSIHRAGERSTRIRFVRFDEVRLRKERRYLIKGLIPREGLVVVWGPPKCRKSFLMLDLAMHVALGWEYRGRRVQQGPVLYCPFEGQAGLQDRIEAFRQKFLSEECEAPPFSLMPIAIDLVKDHGDLITGIRKHFEGRPPALVVLDTLNRSLVGSESSDEDMANYIRAADDVRDAFQCAVIVGHHCGHDAKRPRGHSSLLGAADVVISVRVSGSGEAVATATVEQAKDGASGEAFASRFEVVEVGFDEDGAAITSCVVRDAPDCRPSEEPRKRPLSHATKIALDALEEALTKAGEASPESEQIPHNTRVVRIGAWRRYAYQRNPDAAAEAKRKSFRRSREALQAGGHVGVWGGETGSEDDALCWRKS